MRREAGPTSDKMRLPEVETQLVHEQVQGAEEHVSKKIDEPEGIKTKQENWRLSDAEIQRLVEIATRPVVKAIGLPHAEEDSAYFREVRERLRKENPEELARLNDIIKETRAQQSKGLFAPGKNERNGGKGISKSNGI